MNTSFRRVAVLVVGLFACAGLWISAIRAMPRADQQPIDTHSLRSPRLPDSARKAIESMYPNGAISEVGLERRIVQFYEVSVTEGNRLREVTVTSDGTILEVEELMDPKSVPAGVQNALAEMATVGTLQDIEWVEVHAEFKAVPLDHPRYEYEADVRGDGPERELRLPGEAGAPVASPRERAN